jgi:hypothetical protein
MARLRMMPNTGRPVSSNSCRHRRRNRLPDDTLAKDGPVRFIVEVRTMPPDIQAKARRRELILDLPTGGTR